MEPLLLFSERERRADRRAKGIIVAVFSAICYALLWKWEYLGGSPWRVVVIVAIPLVFCLLAIVNNPVELTVACVIMVGLVALALPTYKHARDKRRKIEELQKQRRLHVEETPSQGTLRPWIASHGLPCAWPCAGAVEVSNWVAILLRRIF